MEPSEAAIDAYIESMIGEMAPAFRDHMVRDAIGVSLRAAYAVDGVRGYEAACREIAILEQNVRDARGDVEKLRAALARAADLLEECNQIRLDAPGGMSRHIKWLIDALDVGDWPLPNVWIGASVEDYRRWQERHAALRDTPAAVHFVSFEPWLSDGMDNLGDLAWLDWAIIGGETGRNHREMNLTSAEYLTQQLDAFGVRIFWKQDSGPRPGKQGRLPDALWNRKEYPVAVSRGDAGSSGR